MTSVDTETVDQPDETPEPEEEPSYQISFERLAALHRSAIVLLAYRRVPTCPSLQKPDHELNDPQALLNEIADHCGDHEGFIRNNMGIQEIAFRTLLARRNQPTPLSDLHYELTERWSTPIRPINITLEGLRRILEGDDHYGFVAVTQ